MNEEDEDPSDEYVNAYNAGYQLSKHEPKLMEILLKSETASKSNAFLKAMEDGKDQQEHEMLVNKMREKPKLSKRRMK